MAFTSKTDNRPYMNVIFGNFYSPAFDDEEFVDETMALIRDLGFNSVMFDTKAWEDFRERCEGGDASQYVKMQEYMGRSAHRHGLAYNFLLLYLNGDNLYPHIRFSPPILGEEIVYLDGTPGRWYKYWSEMAQASMKAHVERILDFYGDGCERCIIGADECGICGAQSGEADGCDACSSPAGTREVLPVCSMWDPVVAPSFDNEGRARYLAFLRELYHGDIGHLNRLYEICAEDFSDLSPQEYWYGVRYTETPFYTEEDVKNRTARFYVWRDNVLWKIREMTLYFEKIGPMLKEKHPDLFLCPDMTQWGYFLNIYGRPQQDMDNEFSDLWDTAMRGIDIYALAPYVDSCHFITIPVTPDGYPDAYVVSCQHSMMRVMNEGKPMIGGIYWGRYIYNDIYAHLSPAEIIGSMTACGMDGYTCYGMNGLDDGGVMNRMDDSFLESLRQGNAWCAKVIPLRRGARKKEIALLFPSEMAHLEPFEVGNNKIRRLDLLGWYRICCDLGYQADVISNHEIERGLLDAYKVLIVSANDCYFAAEHEEMEEKIREWVRGGGALLHGPDDLLAQNCFGIRGMECEKKPYRYGKTIIAQGASFCRYEGGRELAPYVDGGGCCAAVYEGAKMGDGAVYSFGVQIGASYASKNIPHVPYAQGNREMYPLTLSRTTLIKDILARHVTPASGICERGIETGVFENGMVIVNHRPTPYRLPARYRTEIYTRDMSDRGGESGRRLCHRKDCGKEGSFRLSSGADCAGESSRRLCRGEDCAGENIGDFRAAQAGSGVLGAHEAVWVSNE